MIAGQVGVAKAEGVGTAPTAISNRPARADPFVSGSSRNAPLRWRLVRRRVPTKPLNSTPCGQSWARRRRMSSSLETRPDGAPGSDYRGEAEAAERVFDGQP